MTKPQYVYVASSWRNPYQQAVVEILNSAEIPCYDFRNPEGSTGFSWRDVKPSRGYPSITVPADKGSDWETASEYLQMIAHPKAITGFRSDFDAMQRADTFILILPCGKSAHLELGWAVGAGKRTVILLEDPVEPELMYKMVDRISPDMTDLLRYLGIED